MNPTSTGSPGGGRADPEAIGLLSGTGDAGQGLAVRLAAAGQAVWLGSRNGERSSEVVQELHRRWGHDRLATLRPAGNEQAAEADVVVICAVAPQTLATVGRHAAPLRGKVVISMAAPMTRGSRGMITDSPAGGAVAEAVAAALPDTTVAAAFHHLPAKAVLDLDLDLDADILVACDDPTLVEDLAHWFAPVTTGRFLDAGPLANATALEAMTAVLVTINLMTRSRATLRLVDTTVHS